MAGKSKIDFDKLTQLVIQGKTTTQIAKYFKVTLGAVSQAKKKLQIGIEKNVVLESAHKVVKHQVDALEQIEKINRCANELLDTSMNSLRKSKEPKLNDIQTALKPMTQIKDQLQLGIEYHKVLRSGSQANAEFQREIINLLGELDPDVRERFIQRLAQARAIRPAITID